MVLADDLNFHISYIHQTFTDFETQNASVCQFCIVLHCQLTAHIVEIPSAQVQTPNGYVNGKRGKLRRSNFKR